MICKHENTIFCFLIFRNLQSNKFGVLGGASGLSGGVGGAAAGPGLPPPTAHSATDSLHSMGGAGVHVGGSHAPSRSPPPSPSPASGNYNNMVQIDDSIGSIMLGSSHSRYVQHLFWSKLG